MRPYLTVIYDSFHEAIVSRVLYILLLALTLVLIALAPLSYDVKRMVKFNRMSIRDVPAFVQDLREAANADEASPGKRLVAMGNDPLKQLVQSDPGKFTAAQVNDVIDSLNAVLPKNDFYDEATWKDVTLGQETKVLLDKGTEGLSGDDLAYVNRLLLRDAFPVHLGNVPAEELYLTYPLMWAPVPLPITRELLPITVKYVLTGFIDVFVGMFAIFVAILVTAPIMPRTFEPGAIDLLLSKPISRSLLVIAKYIGGCAFVFLSVTYFLVGLWLIMGIQFDVWSPALLYCIPVFLFQFAIYYSVSSLAGVLWRNSIVSIVITVLFFYACFGIGLVKTSIFEPFIINPTKLVRLVDTDEGLVGVTQIGQFVQWNPNLRSWEVVLQSDRRGPENIAMQSIMVGPIYHAPTKTMMYLQQGGGMGPRRMGLSGGKFMTAKWSGNWVAETGASPPTGGSWILQDSDDNVLVVGSAGVFLYQGKGEEKKTKILGFDIQLGGAKSFERIGPDGGVPYFPPFAAAIDPASNRLLIDNQGSLMILNRDGGKGYKVTKQVSREEEVDVVVGLTSEVAIVADENGRIEFREADTLELQQTLRPAGDTPPSAIETSSDGKHVAVLFHNGTLWLYDIEAGEGTTIDNDASAITFHEDQMLVADNKNRVRAYDLASREIVETFWPDSDWYRFTYDWIVQPIYYVFPKPGELNNLLKYLVTEESTTSFQGPQSTGDLREVRQADNIVMPVVHNFIFICVMLGLTCIYVSRLDL
ncbi:ABC transporter permease [Bremerella cremea]|uniref:ABC transporter permease n=1 Tax=Bremerella cremea TaxID=1031537 RepID=UPI0031EA6158